MGTRRDEALDCFAASVLPQQFSTRTAGTTGYEHCRVTV
jgi:hypothetical protein